MTFCPALSNAFFSFSLKVPLDPLLRACVVYRLGQKRLARAYLAEVEAALRELA